MHWPAKSGTRILALHGWLDNAESFGPLAEKMPGFDIVALDFPGHGRSAHRPQGEILHYIDYVADVYAVLELLRWDTCLIMGHSMGAGVATVFAATFPEKLQALICLDGLGPVTGHESELVARLNKSVRRNIAPTAVKRRPYATVAKAVEARLRAGDLSRSSANRLVQRSLRQSGCGYVWRSDPRLKLPSLYYFSERQVEAILSQIRVPTMLVRPAESAYKAEKILRSRLAQVRNAAWVDIAGGHHVHMDQADRLLAPLNAFIDKVMMGSNTA